MPIYVVHLQASNLLVEMHGQVKRAGFFTSRAFRVETAALAEQAALREIAEDPELRAILRNEGEQEPQIEVEKIVEIEELDPEAPTPGYAWFAEEAGDLD